MKCVRVFWRDLYKHEKIQERTSVKVSGFRSHLPGIFIALASLALRGTSPLCSFANICFFHFRFFFLVSVLLGERLPPPFPHTYSWTRWSVCFCLKKCVPPF